MSADPRLDIRFCPLCGHEGLELRVPRRDDKLRPVCLDCGYVHYVGPVVAAGVILHDRDKLCLVRRAHEPGLGLWTFPGGFVDLDDLSAMVSHLSGGEPIFLSTEIGDLNQDGRVSSADLYTLIEILSEESGIK